MGNLSDSTYPSATLKTGSSLDSATAYYNVILSVETNDFEYTTESKKAELIVTIKDEKGNLITTAEGLNFVSVKDEVTGKTIQGFDVTEFSGLTRIRTNYEIYVDEDISEREFGVLSLTHEWEITLTFVNLDTNQINNSGKNFNGSVLLTADDVYAGAAPYIEIIDYDYVTNNYGWINDSFESEINVIDPSGTGIAYTNYCLSDKVCEPDTNLYTGDVTNYTVEQTSNEVAGYTTSKLSSVTKINTNYDHTYNINIGTEGENVLCIYSENAVGESTTVCSRIYSVDTTAPVAATFVIDGSLSSGWYTDNVLEIGYIEGTDKLSGIEFSVIDYPTIVDDTNGKEITITTYDNAGNYSTRSMTIKKDSTAPVINGAMNVTYDKGSAVNVLSGVTCIDNLSTCEISASPATVDTTKTGTTEVTFSAVDEAGNKTTTTVEIKIDAEEPDLNFVVESGVINSNGWANSDFTVEVNATDNSGLGINETKYCITDSESCTPNTALSGNSVTISTEGSNIVCATTTDNNGKSKTLCSEEYSLDKTAPTAGNFNIDGTLGTNDWYTSNILISANDGSDELSGHIATVVDKTSITEDGENQVVTITTTDEAGNTSTRTVTLKKDATKPIVGTIDLSGTLGSNNWYTSDVTISASGYSDETSKVLSSTLSHESIDYNTAGQTVTLTVTDQAGNEETLDVTIMLDKYSPSLIAISSDITITEGDIDLISDYFTVEYSISGGTLECDFINTSTLEIGLNTVACVAVGNNGLEINKAIYIYVKSNVIFGDDYLNTNILLNSSSAGETIDDTIENIVNKGEPNFSSVAKTNDGLYATLDNNDTISYYFRGKADDNYVEFAGYYWRIVRIDGNGNVKLIYSGTSASSSGSSTFISSSSYSSYKVGYKYSSDAYHGYDYDSNIKYMLDEWYKNEMLNTSYEKFIADVPYCSGVTPYADSTGTTIIDDFTTDYTNKTIYYDAYIRLIEEKKPSLICNDSRDDFSVSTAVGNGQLTYPIALLTADEAYFAGGVNLTTNYFYYLYVGSTYWLLSMSYNSSAFSLLTAGSMSIVYSTASPAGIRPVITLKYDTKISSGTGKIDDPYTILIE